MSEFKKRLVFVDQVKIDEEISRWNDLLAGLNDLFGKWNGYFHEQLSLKEFAALQSHHNPGFYIQEKKVMQNPDHKHFQKSLNVKMDKLLEMVELPSHHHLLDGLKEIQVNLLNKVRASDWSQWKDQLFDGEKFEMVPELVSDITERYSYYTANQRQNLVYLYLKRFADTVNILHAGGLSCDLRDWPRMFLNSFKYGELQKLYRDLNYHTSSYPMSRIMIFEISKGMLQDDNYLYRLFTNYSDAEVDQLCEQLSQ